MYIKKFLEDKIIITGSLNDKHLINDIYQEYVTWLGYIADDYKHDLLSCKEFILELKNYPELYIATKFCEGMKLKQD